MLSRLAPDAHHPTPVGVFRDVEGRDYTAEVAAHVAGAVERNGRGDLATLLRSGPTLRI